MRTHVNEKEAMYRRQRVNVKVKQSSTFKFTRDVPYIYLSAYARKNWDFMFNVGQQSTQIEDYQLMCSRHKGCNVNASIFYLVNFFLSFKSHQFKLLPTVPRQ